MPFTRDGDRITLTMDIDTWENLLFSIGYAIGAAFRMEDKRLAYGLARLSNKLNEGNSQFQPYEIPPEYQPDSETWNFD